MSVAPDWFIALLDAIAEYVEAKRHLAPFRMEDAADRAWLLWSTQGKPNDG